MVEIKNKTATASIGPGEFESGVRVTGFAPAIPIIVMQEPYNEDFEL